MGTMVQFGLLVKNSTVFKHKNIILRGFPGVEQSINRDQNINIKYESVSKIEDNELRVK